MGAIYREEVVHALNVKDAWSILMEVENRDYDTDSYNGSFNHCSLGSCLKHFEKWNDKTKAEVQKLMSTDEFDDRLSKWTADYIDCGVEEYFREKLVKTPNKVPAPKFENIYCLKWTSGTGIPCLKEFKEKPNDEEILEIMYLGGHNVSLYKEKKAVTDNKVCSYVRESKVFKSKPKNGCKEMHRYIFVGYCPE